MSYLSKTFLSLTGIILVVSFIYVPQKAEAQITPAPGVQIPVADTFNLPFFAFEANKESLLDAVVFAAMKSVVNNMTSSVVDWVNSGFDGSPAFVTNEYQLNSNITELIFTDFIRDKVRTKYQDAPFANTLESTLIKKHTNNYTDAGYTLDDDVAGDVDKFLEGDFSQGGWSGWYSLTQNPQNNIYGAILESDQEVDRRVSVGRELLENELDRGNGFLSKRDASGNIITPGSVIENQLNEALGSGLRQLELADEFNEVIGALISSLTRRVFSETGLSGLSEQSTNSGSYLEQLIDEVRTQEDFQEFDEEAVNVFNPNE